MIPTSHRHRYHSSHVQSRFAGQFPAYLVRTSDHVPDIEMMMERHRVLQMGDSAAWLEHLTIQRTVPGFLLYAKLSDARQMSHHPEYGAWVRNALPLDEALGPGWRTTSEQEVRMMLGDAPER